MQNSGRKTILSERDCRTLRRIVKRNHRTTAPKVAAELNKHLENPVSTKTVHRELHKASFHGRAAIRKTFAFKEKPYKASGVVQKDSKLVIGAMEEYHFL